MSRKFFRLAPMGCGGDAGAGERKRSDEWQVISDEFGRAPKARARQILATKEHKDLKEEILCSLRFFAANFSTMITPTAGPAVPPYPRPRLQRYSNVAKPWMHSSSQPLVFNNFTTKGGQLHALFRIESTEQIRLMLSGRLRQGFECLPTFFRQRQFIVAPILCTALAIHESLTPQFIDKRHDAAGKYAQLFSQFLLATRAGINHSQNTRVGGRQSERRDAFAKFSRSMSAKLSEQECRACRSAMSR